MITTQKDKEILTCAALQARTPIPELSKQTGYPPHTVRYCLKRLQETELIKYDAVIDVHRLGYIKYELFFSLAAKQTEDGDRLLQDLIASPKVAWLGKFTGEFEFGSIICARDVRELYEFLSDISDRAHGLFSQKAIAVRVGHTQFLPKFLSDKDFTPNEMSTRVVENVAKINQLDHTILKGMSNFPALSQRELAKQLGINPSTIRYRIKQLEESKILIGHRFVLNSLNLGVHYFQLLIDIKGIAPDVRDSMYRFAKEHTNITHFVESLGSWDFELGVYVQEGDNVVDVIREINAKYDTTINSIKVLSGFGDLKVTSYPLDSTP